MESKEIDTNTNTDVGTTMEYVLERYEFSASFKDLMRRLSNKVESHNKNEGNE